MSTVGAVIDRIYRTVLYPPDMQPPFVRATNALTADSADNEITLGTFAVPEDEQILRLGGIIEIGQELMEITDYDPVSRVVTVERSVDGTPLVAHAANARVLLNVFFPRYDAFEIVADNITSLHPKLYTVEVDTITTVAPGVGPMADPLAVEVLGIWDASLNSTVEYQGRIIDHHPAVGGRALLVNTSGTIWVRYRRRCGTPTSEADALSSLGVDPRWVNIIRVGAAADILISREVSEAQIDWISQAFEAEVVRPGTKTTIAIRLAQYRDLLLSRFAAEMDTEYRPKVRKRGAFESVP